MSATKTAIDFEKKVAATNYDPLPLVLTEAKGVWAKDADGKRYLDMMSAYSAVSMGHGHPRILAAMMDQAQKLAVTSRAYHTEVLGPFLDRLVKLTGLDVALPMNTGAEAVETAIKAARRWGHHVKGIAKDRAEIIVAEQNFHGRTTTIIGFSSDESYRDGFGPFTGGFKAVPFADAAAVEAAITPNTAAVLIEPIQGEAGIIVPPDGYLSAACARSARATTSCSSSTRCRQVSAVRANGSRISMTGSARTGSSSARPSAGACIPVSAFVGTREFMQVFNPGSHGSTFGGNALAARIGLEALNVIEDEGLVENSRAMGEYLFERLSAMRSNFVVDVRGRGLWVGVEVDPAVVSGRAVCDALAREGVLSKDTHGTVLRFAPPLTITRAEIDWGMERIERVFAQGVARKAA
jgi:ornithine--oxo-acid transaminase